MLLYHFYPPNPSLHFNSKCTVVLITIFFIIIFKSIWQQTAVHDTHYSSLHFLSTPTCNCCEILNFIMMSNKINSEWKHLRHFYIQTLTHIHTLILIQREYKGFSRNFLSVFFFVSFLLWLRGIDGEKKHEIKINYEQKSLKDMKIFFFNFCFFFLCSVCSSQPARQYQSLFLS